MSDLSGFTEELDEELLSYSDEDVVVSACPHRLIYSGFCADCDLTFNLAELEHVCISTLAAFTTHTVRDL